MITQLHAGFAAEETDPPKVTQQLSDKAENRSQTPCLLFLLLVCNIITSLITYLPSSFLPVLDKKSKNFSCCLVNHPYFTRTPDFPWGVSLSLPMLFPQKKALQGSCLSCCRVLLPLHWEGCLSLKIKFHLFVWYKENQLWHSSHCGNALRQYFNWLPTSILKAS